MHSLEEWLSDAKECSAGWIGLSRSVRVLAPFVALLTPGCSSLIGLDEFGASASSAGGASGSGASGGAGGAAAAGGIANGGTQSAGSAGASPGGIGGIGGSSSGAGGAGPFGAGGTGGTGGEGTTYTIAELRELPDGPVSGVLRGVYVTYVREKGYHIQETRDGPALFVYEGYLSSVVSVGNRIDLHLGAVGTFNRYRDLEGSTVISNDGGSYDVETNLATTLSVGSGLELSEELESKLVVIVGGRVSSGVTTPWSLEYGSAPVKSALYALDDPGLCPGALVDLTTIVSDWPTGYQIISEHAADFTRLDLDGC